MATPPITTFQNDPRRKAWAVRRVADQARAGCLEPGFAINEESPGDAVACFDEHAVGWTLHDLRRELGLPPWLLILYVAIFERLPPAVAKAWAVSFVDAVPVGQDLGLDVYALYAEWLIDPEVGLDPLCHANPQARQLIQDLAALFRRMRRDDLTHAHRDALAAFRAAASELEERFRQAVLIDASDTTTSNCDFRAIQRSLYAIEWMTADRPLPALTCLVSAHLDSLGRLARTPIWLFQGRGALVPNFESPFGSSGFSRRSERDAFVSRLSVWMIRWLHRVSGGDPGSDERAARDFRGRVSEFERQPRRAQTPAFHLPDGLSVPGRAGRLARNALMRAGGALAGACGWVVLLLWPFLLGAANGHPHRGTRWTIAAIGFAGLLCGRLLIKLGRRLDAGYGWHLLLDSRERPVVYLRAFDDDNLTDPRENARWPMFLWVGRTAEEKLVRCVRAVGPVVALGRPGGLLGPPGAARIYVRDADWQRVISAAMTAASLVVLVPGYTEGLRWELRHLRERMDPQRVIVYVPTAKSLQSVRYAETGDVMPFGQFLDDLLSATIGKAYPAAHMDHRFIWFGPDWRYRPLGVIEDTPRWHPVDVDSMATELRPVFRDAGVEPRHPLIFPLVKFLATLIATAATAGVILNGFR